MATDLTGGSNPGANAAKNIIGIINAAAEAHTAQTELQKQIMLHQVQQKMDLQENAAKLQQGVESNINQKNANINWLESMGGNADTPAAQTGNGLGASGTADSGTPAAQGSPMGQLVNPGAPAAPAGPATPPPPVPSPTPMLTQAAQPKPNAVLNSPAPGIGGASIVPPPVNSQQYANLGYQPVEGHQILAERQKNGQSPNVADAHYAMVLNKVKTGTASEGEVGMVHKMNNMDENGQPVGTLQNQTKIQKGLSRIEKNLGYPKGSMTVDMKTGEPEVNPFFLKQYDLQIARETRQPQLDQQTAEKFGDALDPSRYRAGAFGDSKKIFDRGERLSSLIDNAVKYQQGGADSRQIEELAIGMNSMLQGGNQGSVTQVTALVPQTIWGNTQKLTEWLTNNPKGTQQQKFVDRMMTTVNNEMATAKTQMDRTRIQRIATFDPWIQRNPDQAENMMRSYGIDPQEYADWKSGGFKPVSAIQSGGSSNNSGGGYTEGQTATNSQTGQTLTYRGGKWQ